MPNSPGLHANALTMIVNCSSSMEEVATAQLLLRNATDGSWQLHAVAQRK